MRLIFAPDPEQNTSGKTVLIQDANGKTKWVVGITGESRVTVITIEGKHEASASIALHRGIFSTKAEFTTLSGDRIKVRRQRSKLPVFEGNDWAVKGKSYPEKFYIDAGYGKIATVHGREGTNSARNISKSEGIDPSRFLYYTIDYSLTAIPIDVVCGVIAILVLCD